MKFYPMTFNERFKEYLRQEDEILEREKRNQQKKKMQDCEITIKEHHNLLKDDPEHLSTEFLLEMTGCECRKKK